MSGSPSISSKQFIKILKKLGYELKDTTKHYQFVHPETGRKVTVQHPVKDVQPRNLASMLRQANLTKKQFLKLYYE